MLGGGKVKAGLGWGKRTVVRGAGAVVGIGSAAVRGRRNAGRRGSMLGVWMAGRGQEREREGSASRGRTTDKTAGKWALVRGEESVGYTPSFERPSMHVP